MKDDSALARPAVAAWARAVDFERELSPASARALLEVRFSSRQHERVRKLLDKSRSGRLTAAEEEQLDTYELLGSLLGILHSKARQALKKRAAGA